MMTTTKGTTPEVYQSLIYFLSKKKRQKKTKQVNKICQKPCHTHQKLLWHRLIKEHSDKKTVYCATIHLKANICLIYFSVKNKIWTISFQVNVALARDSKHVHLVPGNLISCILCHKRPPVICMG